MMDSREIVVKGIGKAAATPDLLYSETNFLMCESAAAYSTDGSMDIDIVPEDIKVSDAATLAWAIE